MRPEIKEAIQEFKQTLAAIKGQDYAENTSVEYSHGWISIKFPQDGIPTHQQVSSKCRLADLVMLTRNSKNPIGLNELHDISKTIRDRKATQAAQIARLKKQKTAGLWDAISEIFGKLADVWTAHPIVLSFLGFLLVGFVCRLLDPPSPNSSSSSPRSEAKEKYCRWPGCVKPPSGFWNADTGYCNEHAQMARDLQNLDEKVRKQGY